MAIKITSANDALEIGPLVVVIYAQPGIGKTTLAYTAAQPLLLDFDRGSHRAPNRGDSVQISQWTDMTRMDEEDLRGYSTVIVDTGGRALDILEQHLVSKNPKLRNRAGQLTLQGHGERKAMYAAWVKRVRSLGKDVVIVLHSEEQQADGELVERIDMTRGPRNETYRIADVMGRLHLVNDKRRFTMAPSDTAFGKDPAGLGHIEIDDINANPNALAEVITAIRETLQARNSSAASPVGSPAGARPAVDDDAAPVDDDPFIEPQADTDGLADQFTTMARNLAEQKADREAQMAVLESAKAAGFEWDKAARRFVAAGAS